MLTSASALKVKKIQLYQRKKNKPKHTTTLNTHLQRDLQTSYCRPNHSHLGIMTDCFDLPKNARNNFTSLLCPFSAVMWAKHSHVHQVATTKPS